MLYVGFIDNLVTAVDKYTVCITVPCMNMKRASVIMGISAIAAAIIFGAVAASPHPKAMAQEDQDTMTVVEQKTAQSAPDPLPGHSMHQAVLVLPPREDGAIYDGDITWTASKNVEVVVLHAYNDTGIDKAHGEPLTAPFGDGKVAITLYKIPSNSPIASGSTHFTGSALAFHTLSGQEFTVTYSVKATVNEQTG